MAARAALNPTEISQMYPLFFSCKSAMDHLLNLINDQKEKKNCRKLKCFHESLWVLIIPLICRSFPVSFLLRLQIGSKSQIGEEEEEGKLNIWVNFRFTTFYGTIHLYHHWNDIFKNIFFIKGQRFLYSCYIYIYNKLNKILKKIFFYVFEL